MTVTETIKQAVGLDDGARKSLKHGLAANGSCVTVNHSLFGFIADKALQLSPEKPCLKLVSLWPIEIVVRIFLFH